MNTILEVHNLVELSEDNAQLLDLIADQVEQCRNAGDPLGAGEWLASAFPYLKQDQVDEAFSKVVTLWASPLVIKVLPSSIEDLISRIGEFVPEDLTLALVGATFRFLRFPHPLPPRVNDLAFRLTQPISNLFGLGGRRPIDACIAAATKLGTIGSEALAAVDAFTNTSCMTAKMASIEVARKAHQLKGISLSGERPILSEVDVLLSPSFRKFCESCERQHADGVIKRAASLREQAHRIAYHKGARTNSVLWNMVVARVARHIMDLVDEANLL